ncbi:polysaccharide biosynthesis tyrosine autokinase [Pseudonocardia phyllosphaerae]|uniref:polysaccharide biosynthesis tyrosine autokinase n=1 Tax=Pseudonocardia phyllosphaerae TaxID=3390502 RepID=UPI00397CB508
MDISDNLRTLRERWHIVVAAVIVGLLGAGVACVLRPVTYTASVTMYIAAPGIQDSNSAASNGQLAQERAKSYIELVHSTPVMEQVIRQLDLNESPDDLASRIRVDHPLESTVLEAQADAPEPEAAARLANEYGQAFAGFATGLDSNRGSADEQNLTVRVVQSAVPPAAPSSPGVAMILGLGLLMGLAVGVCATLLGNRLDRSVRTASRLSTAAGGTPELGSIPKVDNVDAALLAGADPSFSEEVRRLRTSVCHSSATTYGVVPRSLLVVSSVEREGRSSTVVALATAFAEAGNEVLVVDGDLRRPRLGEITGVRRTGGLTAILTGHAALSDVVVSWRERIDVVPSGPVPEHPAALLGSSHFRDFVREVEGRYDIVLIDSSPLVPVMDAVGMAEVIAGVVLVGCASHTTLTDVRSAVSLLHRARVRPCGTVLTMAPPYDGGARSRYVADPVSTGDQSATRLRPVPGPRGDSRADTESPTARIPVGAAGHGGHEGEAQVGDKIRDNLDRSGSAPAEGGSPAQRH